MSERLTPYQPRGFNVLAKIKRAQDARRFARYLRGVAHTSSAEDARAYEVARKAEEKARSLEKSLHG
jgi:hypothetical protein